jgi:hypothetical protein
VAAQIKPQHPEIGRECRHDLVSARAIRADAVDQQHERSFVAIVPTAESWRIGALQHPLGHPSPSPDHVMRAV